MQYAKFAHAPIYTDCMAHAFYCRFGCGSLVAFFCSNTLNPHNLNSLCDSMPLYSLRFLERFDARSKMTKVDRDIMDDRPMKKKTSPSWHNSFTVFAQVDWYCCCFCCFCHCHRSRVDAMWQITKLTISLKSTARLDTAHSTHTIILIYIPIVYALGQLNY